MGLRELSFGLRAGIRCRMNERQLWVEILPWFKVCKVHTPGNIINARISRIKQPQHHYYNFPLTLNLNSYVSHIT